MKPSPSPLLVTAIPHRSGFTYVPPGSTAAAAMTQGQLRAVPFWAPRTRVYDRIGAEVTTVGEAGSLVRLGIFADDGNGMPGALALDAGTIAGDALGYMTIVIAQLLGFGLWWLASVAQLCPTTPPTMRAVSSSAVEMGFSGLPSATTLIAYSDAGSYASGGLPANWTYGSIQGNTTRVGMRAA